MKSMDPRSFVVSLQEKTAGKARHFVVGMAKRSDDECDTFLLGPTHRCGPWTEIPIESVARIVPLTNGACGAHQHPIVAVYFRDEHDPTARALTQLLHTMQDEVLAQFAGGAGTMVARTASGNGSGGDEPPVCFCIPLPFCWERDWTLDYPPGTPPPAAHPSPTYDCAWALVPLCLPRLPWPF